MHVPGWHEGTLNLQREGKLAMAGIVQEQHPDRARLFMQWKRMEWPILVDSLNLLGVDAVPITVAIDEHGIVRAAGIKLSEAAHFAENFAAATYSAPSEPPQSPILPDAETLKRTGRWQSYADALFLWGEGGRFREVIDAYERALGAAGDLAPPVLFRLGVAYRARYDSVQRQPGDFQAAVDHWQKALDRNPNQYIWRRRIQQYGPRLDKPYPFYDWVTQAREEIRRRGEEPAPLVVEPGGAEIATPAKTLAAQPDSTEPDPGGRIHRDEMPFVLVERTVVPPAVRPGSTGRTHIVFRPNTARKAHWNNEAGDLVVWIDPPAGWETDARRLTVPNPPAAVSQEQRRVEFEFRVPEAAPAGETEVPAYALYYVCEDEHGVCLYRRQDLPLSVRVAR